MNLLWTLFLSLLAACQAVLYLPGVAPRDYMNGDSIELKVNKLSSDVTQLPYLYYDKLPFCVPEKIVDEVENLGEILSGDRIENSLYDLRMGENVACRVLCKSKSLSKEEVSDLVDLVNNEYRVSWVLDNLPAAMPVLLPSDDNEFEMVNGYETGFPVGGIGNPDGYKEPNSKEGSVYIHNHHNIKIKVHTSPVDESAKRIVGFEVDPDSIEHGSSQYDESNPASFPETCLDRQAPPLVLKDKGADSKENIEIVFTYSVIFEESTTEWHTRWDRYLLNTDSSIHWFSVVNSAIIVLVLTGMVALIMIRTLYNDFRRYNQINDPEEEADDSGWKLVHGDVFREPSRPMMLSVLVGSGLQVAFCGLVVLIFAVLGFLSPANRGAMLTSMIVLFVLTSVIAGYASTRLYKANKGVNWKKNTLMTALTLPGVVFVIFFVLNFFIWGEKSSGAVPFGTLAALVAMWFGVSVPLVFFGAYIAARRSVPPPPVGVKLIPRQIPPQVWYMSPWFLVTVGGVLPFGAVFMELFFILGAVWGHQIYYVFSFLMMVYVILIITCAEISVVLCYFALCAEDYHWWWRAFMTSGASAFYMLAYFVFYFFTKLSITKGVSALLYFGYSLAAALMFFVMTGSVGFYACYYFVWILFDSIKVD